MINLAPIIEALKISRNLSIISLAGLLALGLQTKAQDPLSRMSRMGRSGGGKGGDTALQHRTGLEDSITLYYRFLDSSRLRKMDSSIYDFSKKIALPPTYIDLGNAGTAAHGLIFSPRMLPGWDEGLHAYDIYRITPEDTRFYNTTRPYTELGYLLGSKAEQMINIVHTQNISRNWNFALQYRLINSPGIFQNQNTNHNNYRFNSWYQSKNKRYQAFLIALGNKLQSSENGGIRDLKDLDSNAFTDRSTVPTKLGKNNVFTPNPFSVNISTGTKYSNGTFMLRQQYDIIGKKDSIVTDSTIIPLFYPKFRAEHTIEYSTYIYQFMDQDPDTAFYIHNYNFISTPDTFRIQDSWKELINDFSLYQFPDNKNPQQFFKVGSSLQDLKGNFDAGSRTLYNVFVHGEYRNRTRNQKWDVEANGRFYLNGFNSGDYNGYISLKRQISKQLGFLQIGFENVNRTPSFVFDKESSFGFGVQGNENFKKENTTHIFGSFELPQQNLRLTGSYYLINNYTFYQGYYQASQQSNLFNLLQVGAEKIITIKKDWIWRLFLVLQQKAGSSPLNLPLLFTRNQIGYEGKLGFKNLTICFGAEFRYFTAYKADGYSPLIGQFFIQNESTLKQKLPDITAYLHLRIRSFTAYVRAENLNTAQIGPNGFGFTNYNYVAPSYPYPGLRLRLGIFWGFVN
jgi:Putative porin